jgi:hypothetical protein
MEMRTKQHGASDRSDVLGPGQRERSMLIEHQPRAHETLKCTLRSHGRTTKRIVATVVGPRAGGAGRRTPRKASRSHHGNGPCQPGISGVV